MDFTEYTRYSRQYQRTYRIEAPEPCTRTAQSSRFGRNRRVHRILYLAVKKGNILVNILLLKILFANYCLLFLNLFPAQLNLA